MARDKPVLPYLCNICCGLVYLLAITNNPLPVRLDLAVLVSVVAVHGVMEFLSSCLPDVAA